MSERRLRPYEYAQRRVAAVKSGAHSPTIVRPRSDVLYEHLRRRVVRASGPTDPRLRIRLRLLAVLLAKIETAEAWLAQQPDELFADALAGTVHPLVDRVERWIGAASPMVSTLPDAAGRAIADDFPSLRDSRRGGRHARD